MSSDIHQALERASSTPPSPTALAEAQAETLAADRPLLSLVLRRAAPRSTVCQRQTVHRCVSLSPCPQRKMWERLVWMTIVNIL